MSWSVRPKPIDTSEMVNLQTVEKFEDLLSNIDALAEKCNDAFQIAITPAIMWGNADAFAEKQEELQKRQIDLKIQFGKNITYLHMTNIVIPHWNSPSNSPMAHLDSPAVPRSQSVSPSVSFSSVSRSTSTSDYSRIKNSETE